MSTYAFQYAYDAAGNRTKQVKDSVPTFHHYDAANELIMWYENGSSAQFHFLEYDANGSMTHDAYPKAVSGKVLLDAQFEGSTDGADGETATESGTISYEKGELPGTEAVRVAGPGGTGKIEYPASGNLTDGEGTILIRLKSDDWDDATHTTQVAIRLWKDSSNYIDIYLDTSAEELLVVIYAGGVEQLNFAVSTVGWSDGEWYHLALTYDSSGAQFYVNGENELMTTSITIPTGLTDVYVGSKHDGSDAWYGLINEVLLFDGDVGTGIAQVSDRTGGPSYTTYFEYGDHGLTTKITPPAGS